MQSVAIWSMGRAQCAIQIHNMQPLRALVHPMARHLRRVFAKDRFRIWITLTQTHAAPTPKINRRIDNHILQTISAIVAALK